MKKLLITTAAILAAAVTVAGVSRHHEAPTRTRMASLEKPGRVATTFEEDANRLELMEKELESVGLKVKKTFSYVDGKMTPAYAWDTAHLQRYFAAHPNASEEKLIPALESYIEAANEHLNRYSDVYSTRASELGGSFQAKVRISSEALSKLKSI